MKLKDLFKTGAAVCAVLGGLSLGAPVAHAGFIMEGLQPFSVRACPEGQPLADPVVMAPPSAVTGTPSRYNDGGIPRFKPQNCPSPGGGKGSSTGGGKWSVPQK